MVYTFAPLFAFWFNTENRGKGTLTFLNNLLERLGGWPVLLGDKWDENNFNWLELLHKFRNHGLPSNYLFTVGLGVNLKNSSQRMIEVSSVL